MTAMALREWLRWWREPPHLRAIPRHPTGRDRIATIVTDNYCSTAHRGRRNTEEGDAFAGEFDT